MGKKGGVPGPLGIDAGLRRRGSAYPASSEPSRLWQVQGCQGAQ